MALIIVGAVALVAALLFGLFMLGPPTPKEGLSRRDALLGILTLGILAMAAWGFDLREWL